MKTISSLLPGNLDLVTFEDWYSSYPKKTNRTKAEKLWDKLSAGEKHLALVDIPERIDRHSQWQDKQFIPAPDVYLRNKKWTDEIITARTLNDKQQQAEDGTPIGRLWTLLKQMYGHKRWESQYGEEPPFMWRKKLGDVTPVETAKIINYLETHESLPGVLPDLPMITRIRRIGRDFVEIKRLPAPEVSREVIDSQLSEMYKLLGVKDNVIPSIRKKPISL